MREEISHTTPAIAGLALGLSALGSNRVLVLAASGAGRSRFGPGSRSVGRTIMSGWHDRHRQHERHRGTAGAVHSTQKATLVLSQRFSGATLGAAHWLRTHLFPA